MNRRILKNSIITPDGTELWSKSRNMYIEHKDAISGELYINDGGNEFFRRSVNTIPFKDISVIDDGSFETCRYHMHLGVRYDVHKNLLRDTRWVAIKDLDIEHIWNILLHAPYIDDYYKQVMVEEIVHREEIWLDENKQL